MLGQRWRSEIEPVGRYKTWGIRGSGLGDLKCCNACRVAIPTALDVKRIRWIAKRLEHDAE